MANDPGSGIASNFVASQEIARCWRIEGTERERVAQVLVRRFTKSSKAAGWAHGSTVAQRLHIAQAVLVNAAATLRPRPLQFAIYAGEVRLLLSGLLLGRNQPLRIRPSLRKASSHVQRFVTEGAALAVTTGLAQPYGWSLSRGLPVHVDLAFSWAGVRPDLIFPVGKNQRIAGESRGRRVAKAAASMHMSQATRLEQLGKWQRGPDGSKWFMAWSWFTDTGTVVDYFDPGRRRPMEPEVVAHGDAIADKLWATAPALDADLLGRAVRGSWIYCDMFSVDEGTVQAFIGVFGEAVDPQLLGTYRLGEAQVEIAISSRLIVVVNSGGGMDFADVVGALRQLE